MAAVDFSAVRSMDDFLINPTIYTASTHAPQTDMSDTEQYVPGTPSSVILFKQTAGKHAEQQDDILRDLPEDPTFWRSYASDEEMASPIGDEDDELSVQSIRSSGSSSSSSLDNLSDASLPEQLAGTCSKVERQCSKAQAVVLRPAGRPRVVSVSSPTSPRFPVLEQAQAVQIRRPVAPQRQASLSNSSEDERNSSVGSDSGRKSSVSTAPSSISEQQPRSIRRKPSQEQLAASDDRVPMTISSRRGSIPLNFMVPRSKPLMDAAPTPPASASLSPPAAASSDYARRDASFESTSSGNMTSATPSASSGRRRMQKISSTLNLNRFGSRARNAARSDSMRSSSAQSSDFECETVLQPPPRSAARPKLVARGANERAPPLRLPPCPRSPVDDLADDDDVESQHDFLNEVIDHVWPLRVDSSAKRSSHGFSYGERWAASGLNSDAVGQRRRSLSAEIGSASWQA